MLLANKMLDKCQLFHLSFVIVKLRSSDVLLFAARGALAITSIASFTHVARLPAGSYEWLTVPWHIL